MFKNIQQSVTGIIESQTIYSIKAHPVFTILIKIAIQLCKLSTLYAIILK